MRRHWAAMVPAVLLVAVMVPGFAAESREQRADATDKGNGTAKKQKVTHTPQQVALEFVSLIDRGRAPWQCYGHYARIFQFLAQQQLKAKGGGQAVASRRRKLANQYQSLSEMILEMARYAKLRTNIAENNGVDIPREKRQEAFVSAGKRHDELLANFKKITGVGTPPKQPDRR